MNTPFNSFPDLNAALAALPTSPPNTVRVYRGQTQDYPKLEPIGLRRPIRNEVIWHCYSTQLYNSLLPDFVGKEGEVTSEMLTAFGLWFHAVAQHYGPGSDFLDVTRSLEVALWFALHDTEKVRLAGSIGPPGPPDPKTDHPTAGELIGYRPRNDPGFLYVFDLPKWNGEGLPEAGMVVDLADAPTVFSSSPRMRAQSACLIYCRDKDGIPLDMRDRLVPRTPLVVSRPMSGVPGLERQVADLFPSPEQDEWYARLLSVPMAYDPTLVPPKLRRPIPVTVYFDKENKRYTREVHFRDVSFPPPLLHRVFGGFERADGRLDPNTLHPGAIPIVLEAPLLFPYPAGDSELWHQGLLATDIPDRCPVYDLKDKAQCGEIPLTNVLFEFSLLEQVGWDRIVKTNAHVHLMRGIWLRRQGDEFQAALVYQDLPGSDPGISPFLPLRYDPGLGQFVALLQRDKPGLPISAEPEIAKPIFIALMLLRHLSPVLKAEASPRAQIELGHENGPPKNHILVACARDAARLFRVRCNPHNPDWFVLRDTAKPDEPFCAVSKTDGVLKLESSKPYSRIPADEIRSRLRV